MQAACRDGCCNIGRGCLDHLSQENEFMMFSRIPRVLVLFFLAVTLCAPNQSNGEGEAHLDIVLKDHINHEWSNELLGYDVTFDPGTCHLSTLELTAPEGALPFQLSDVQADGNDFVTSARLWLITDLSALSEKSFILSYGSEQQTPPTMPASDLTVNVQPSYVEFTTTKAGVRFLTGNETFVATAPGNVPGPVIGLRTLENTWIGGGSLYGSRNITGYSTTVETGPVFAGAEVVYTYASGDTFTVSARMAAGQEVIVIRSESNVHAPDDGWSLNLSTGYSSPILSIYGEYVNNKWGMSYGDIGHGAISAEPVGDVYNIVPWEDWWDGSTRTCLVLSSPGSATALAVASYDPAAWIDPSYMQTYPDYVWSMNTFKALPLYKAADGEISIKCSTAIGERKWFVGFSPKTADADETFRNATLLHDGKYGCQNLDIVKEYDLDWVTGPEVVYPHLYVAPEDVEEARAQLGSVASIEGTVYRYYRSDDNVRIQIGGRDLVQHMVDSAYSVPKYMSTFENNSNKFDLMRHSTWLTNLFDALMGTGELSVAEQKLLRAQIAFLGYRLNSTYVWDIDRGLTGDVNNMHISYMCNLGLVACALPQHPNATTWADKAVYWVATRLDENVGENGVWLPENMHYANVSLGSMLPFAIAAQFAGFRSFLEEEELPLCVTYVAKQLTARDPRYSDMRCQPPEQVQSRAMRSMPPGLVAKATAHLDPGYSSAMQWAWNEQANYSHMENDSLILFNDIATDPLLPAAQPAWQSERFPGASVVMRHGLGTADEHYLALLLGQFGDYYLSQPGATTTYARGRPLAMVFAGAYQLCTAESFLTNGVSLARMPPANTQERIQNLRHIGPAQIAYFSGMPRQDYAFLDLHLDRPLPIGNSYFKDKLPTLSTWPTLLQEATGAGVTWYRQVLFIKGIAPTDPSYYLYRDTVFGGQPTVWQMWTLSEKIGTPAEVADLEAFLADAPGNSVTPPRELSGDRFTAIGQFGVDVEYYIASPSDTPRQTVRWGYDLPAGPPSNWHEYQDLLHLQRTDNGPYYVALYPRLRDEPVPEFSTLGNGRIVKTTGAFGTDYGFLSENTITVSAENVTFSGVHGSVQDRTNGLVLCVGAEGEVSYGDYSLSSFLDASVEIIGTIATVSTSHDRSGQQIVIVGLPDGIILSSPIPSVTFTLIGGSTHEIVMPDGITSVAFTIGAPTLGISADTSAWDLGGLNAGSVVTRDNAIVVTNTGNIAEDFTLRQAAPTGWSIGTSVADVGFNKYVLAARLQSVKPGSGDFVDANVVTELVQQCVDGKFVGGNNIPSDASEDLWLLFKAPTSSIIASQQTITLTIGCVAH